MKRFPILRYLLLIFLCSSLVGLPSTHIRAQIDEGRRPIDMMIIIDNSHSMYGSDGSDPEQLRIVGADIFIARLGFGEINSKEYRAGVISMGGEPTMVAPLQPLTKMRGVLAREISNPEDAGGTHIIKALKMAYQELRDSGDPTHMPAVVLLTDGVPDPPEGQSNADIENLVSANSDIPLFVMLLQGERGKSSEEYQRYMEFWEGLQSKYTHIFTYPVEDAAQLERTYNEIVAQLQSTVPSEGRTLRPGEKLEVYVSRYVNKLVVTVVHRNEERGDVVIKDPSGTVVRDSDADVEHFDDPDNPAEVFSIGRGRLERFLDKKWTIESSDEVYIYLDRQGVYSIHFESPEVSLMDVSNVYLAIGRHSPSEPLVIQFDLTDIDGKPVLEPQPIYGTVMHPDGSEATLPIPASIAPDSGGIYEIVYDYSTFPEAMSEPGRFTFFIKAGDALSVSGEDSDTTRERIPIASAKLYVDVGQGIYIRSFEPDPVTCAPGQPAEVTVHVGDADTADPSTVHLRVFYSGQDVELSRNSDGSFSGDLAPLCAALITPLPCSTSSDATFQARLVAQSLEGEVMPPSEREITVMAHAVDCTPTPTPLPPPTPTPTPTPIPDSDGDGWNDLEDQCPDESGVRQFQGCPIPWWAWLGGGLLAAGLLAFVVFYLLPWLIVHISPPPRAYVQVVEKGRKGVVKKVYEAGMMRRTNKVTIGGDRKKDTIFIRGLRPREFRVEKQGERVVLVDAKGLHKGTFSAKGFNWVGTSNGDIKLRISLDQTRLR